MDSIPPIALFIFGLLGTLFGYVIKSIISPPDQTKALAEKTKQNDESNSRANYKAKELEQANTQIENSVATIKRLAKDKDDALNANTYLLEQSAEQESVISTLRQSQAGADNVRSELNKQIDDNNQLQVQLTGVESDNEGLCKEKKDYIAMIDKKNTIINNNQSVIRDLEKKILASKNSDTAQSARSLEKFETRWANTSANWRKRIDNNVRKAVKEARAKAKA